MKKIILIVVLGFAILSVPLFSEAQVQNAENTAEEYTRVITGRADKIVDEIQFENDTIKLQVRDILVDHYRFLNDAEESRNADVAKMKEEFAENKELRNVKIDLRKAEQEIKVRDHHFAFISQLKMLITEDQIDEVKNGLTYNVLNVTYVATLDMIPTLTAEEKNQIMIWLIEAREHAIDGGSSREKHGWFGKYKGRINNYLSKRGYDLTKEREAWEARLKKEGKKL